MNKKLQVVLLMLFTLSANAQKKVVQLYSGAAPGSENWTWDQTESADNMYHANTIYNVSHPAITVYLPDSTIANTGAGLIICPGGGFQSLSIMQEGYQVAQWCQKHGITAFLLKYRLIHTIGNDPYKQEVDRRGKAAFEPERKAVMAMAIADGRKAIAYVREHAAEYNISSSRVGIIGFSAGGTIAASMAYNYTPENRPDFVASIYAYFPPEMQTNVPQDAPPMFIAAAADDQLSAHAVALYNTWINSKHAAELHIYSTGGHGFGMNVKGLPSDTWSDRFFDWMKLNGFLKPLSDVKTPAMKKAEDWANFQKYVELRMKNDWAWLSNYAKADSLLAITPPPPGKPRIVFMGNSITQNWAEMDSAFFKTNGYIGHGIGGQTSSQMLVRFREDIINIHPTAVVISAGTNDIAQNTGYISLENIYGNIISMAELAKANGIKPIMTSILPATDFSWHRGLEPAEKIIKVNSWVKAYAVKNHLVYVDYWSALVNDKKGLKPELTLDGLVHPNMAGYKIMEPLVKKGIAEALAPPPPKAGAKKR